ncbi:tyrosyl-DNA phosphodiesterase I [Chytridium lagenaria]|nr:tyrosyl-DNA phosphodiesterase I [Chytridium lagenaria]
MNIVYISVLTSIRYDINLTLLTFIGTHHSKMMIIFYKDDTARVVIHTANLVEKDWGKKSQGCWISPLLPKKPQTKSLASPYVTSEFEHDFFLYLKAYGKDLEVLCERLQYFDFSGIRASLVASVPGSHKAKDHKMKLWGHARMADLLGNVPLSEGCKKESTVVFQFSSIGALGNDDKWLANEFGSSLSMCAANGVKSRPPIKIVFPTVEDVRDSNQGWRAGNSIPFSNENWVKQKSYMKPLLHKWIANDSLRKYAMPHIKTFARLNEKTGDISWLYVGSHNLSKAAWGKYELKNTQLHIRSYEIGVLLHPAIFKVSFSTPYSI